MTLTPSYGMGTIQTIEFSKGLGRLQALLGEQVRVLANFRGTFGSCAIYGRLSSVETLGPDDSSISILLDDRQSIMLDPIDTEVLFAEPDDDRDSWIEFHLPSGVVVSVEPDSAEAPAAGETLAPAGRPQ